MEHFWGWLQNNWVDLIQTIGIVAGLAFTAVSFKREEQTRRISNLLSLKEEHRELWSIVHQNPGFSRILDPDVDLVANPMTNEEEVFLRQMIVHFAVGYEMVRTGTPLDIGAVKGDVAEVFSLPLPKLAFARARHGQSPEFVRFVEEALTKLL